MSEEKKKLGVKCSIHEQNSSKCPVFADTVGEQYMLSNLDFSFEIWPLFNRVADNEVSCCSGLGCALFED